MPSEPLIALALSLLISLAPFLPAAEKSAPEEEPAPAVEEQPALSAEQLAALAQTPASWFDEPALLDALSKLPHYDETRAQRYLAYRTGSVWTLEQVLRIGPGDVLFGISFPRYSKRTLSAMQYARDRGAKVIALTDSQLSPLARVADHLLLARSDMASFVASVINALIVAVGMSRRDEIEHTFNKLESIWEKYDVYEKPEDDTN